MLRRRASSTSQLLRRRRPAAFRRARASRPACSRSHCTSDIELARALVGRAARTRLSVARAARARHARSAFGSDAPVEPLDLAARSARRGHPRARGPAASLRARSSASTLDQALRACTEAPARLAGAWPRLGRARAGSAPADLVVWDRDLHAHRPAALCTARPVRDGARTGGSCTGREGADESRDRARPAGDAAR